MTMRPEHVIFAEREGLGRVYNCGDCNNIHVQVGPVSLTLTPDAYMELVNLLSRSAANFETYLHEAGGEDHELRH